MSLQEMIREIPALSIDERKRLVIYILDTLTGEPSAKKRSILEFEGAGAHLYDGTDAQEYVNRLRDEWDE